ncbi:MAG: bifunctional enoyl-CoA hydratase/phosphate acetyltransferase, partial [bacterium]|nr:bifunctional enoyl-CoA hydratase/phosphate acetyltransferase [bacterium]
PILFGDKKAIEEAAQKAGVDIKGWEIHDIKDMAEASRAAVKAVSSGQADFLMKGLVATSTFLKAVLDKEVGLRTGRLLSHVAVMESALYPKLFLLTDGGMNVKPDLTAKVDIINNAVEIAHKLGVEKPKVAVLTALEVVNPEMPETIDAAHLSKMNDRGQIKGCIVDGPLALDLAVSAEAAAHKKVKSLVAGDADIFLAPEIASGNMLAKGLIYLGGAKAAGLIAGASKPVVMLSRSDSKQQKLNSIALGVVSC